MAKSKLSSLSEVLGVIVGEQRATVEDIIIGPELSTKADRFKELTAINDRLNSQFKTTNTLIRMGDRVGKPLPSIVTNMPSLDHRLIQCGGIPRGRIVEFFGPESGGKTTEALYIIGQEQQHTDNLCAFVDAEHALDPTWAAKNGVNMDDLIVSQPDSGEQALEIVEELVRSRVVSLIVVDSVAALVPQAELDGEMGDSHMGLQARLMSQACRKLTALCDKTGVTIIFINQIREKIGVMFGSPETTTGGRALKFYSSVRIDIRKIGALKDGDQVIGHNMRLKIVKNKVGAPFKEVEIQLLYDSGINWAGDWLTYGVELGAVTKAGAWYSVNGERIGQGLEKSSNTLKSSPELLQLVQKVVLDKINTP